MHCERLICAFVCPNPVGHIITLLQCYIDTPSVLPHSGAAQSGQLSTILDLDSDLLARLGTYLVSYAEEMHRTSSCKRSRSLTQRESLGIIMLKRRLLAHLDVPILIPHALTQQSRAPRDHHTYSNHISLPLLHHFLPSLVPHQQQEQSQVLVLPLVDGVLIL
ncbi:hypothetical protein BDR07DRAFT_473495 [Suillus spraguei]|nr:hypothetical protein BDR07DRAFT_473495 [Suillus spraguei]